MEFLSIVLFSIVVIRILWGIISTPFSEQKRYNKMMKRLKNSALEMKPDKFEEIRQQTLGKNRTIDDFSGIYILYNKTNGKYYIGQSNTVFSRVDQHFKGRGNGDVYHHFRSGHNWRIRLLDLKETNFRTLNELERHFIDYYDAFKNGYNRTRGNNG